MKIFSKQGLGTPGAVLKVHSKPRVQVAKKRILLMEHGGNVNGGRKEGGGRRKEVALLVRYATYVT